MQITEKNSLNRQQKNSLHLHYIAQHIITLPVYFHDVVTHFAEFLPKIVSIAISFDDKTSFSSRQHKVNCVLLGKIVEARKDLHWYASKYFESQPSPFEDRDQNTSKRSKMSQNITVSDLELIESCYALLKSDPQFYKNKWNWSDFIKYLNNEKPEIQWIACHCLAIVTQMSENQLKNLIFSKLPVETHEKFSCCFNSSSTLSKSDSKSLGLDQHPVISINKNQLEEVVEISGVYIPKLQSSVSSNQNLVIANSTYNNLKKLAFGLFSKKAICLQGPVGSGKTTLVEYIANKTGRKLGENFIKVQLGDQTDSKMLLGTYRCTDIPGEFVWQPGVVTQVNLIEFF